MACLMQFSASCREELISSMRLNLVTTWVSHHKWPKVLSTNSSKNSRQSIRKSSLAKEMPSKRDGKSTKKQLRLQRKKKRTPQRIQLPKSKKSKTQRRNPPILNSPNLQNLLKLSQLNKFKRSKKRSKRLSQK